MTAKAMREKAIEATENGIWSAINKKASGGGLNLHLYKGVVSTVMVKKLQEKGFSVEFVSDYVEIHW